MCRGDYGSKLTYLLSRLMDIRKRSPGTKSVVFSQWSRLLSLVASALKDNGIGYSYLSGKNRYPSNINQVVRVDGHWGFECMCVCVCQGRAA